MIQITNLTLSYSGSDTPALQRVNLEVQDGEFLLISGPTGSGKTSLLMAINGLVPNFTGGDLSGSIRIDGAEVLADKPHKLAHLVGYVSQRPEGSFVAETVIDELAFGLEQLGFSQLEMQRSISAVAGKLGITHLLDRQVAELSGGEQQRVAIAAALAAGQKILLLDEPTSALDRDNALQVIQLLKSLAIDHGVTVILSEHRFENLSEHLESIALIHSDGTLQKHRHDSSSALKALELDHDWQLPRENFNAEIIGLFGPNGAGKTTLLWQLIEKHDAVMVPQRASDLLFLQNVSAEFEESDVFARVSAGSTAKLFASLVGRVDPQLHPRDLSAGQQLALVLAVQLIRGEPILLLDEPTRGLDQTARRELAKLLRALQLEGKTIVVATHDEHFLGQIADRIVKISNSTSAEAVL